MVVDISTEVIGFHGTNLDAAARIVVGDVEFSTQSYDWLGDGFYLWQDSPWRAREWAESRHGQDAAVVAVRVDLAGCLDLLNPKWQALLRDADAQLVLECLAEGRVVPTNTPSGNRARDCATINWYCERASESGLLVRSVRAVFEEGEPIFEASAIRTRSHVQIAVRDVTAILEVEEISW